MADGGALAVDAFAALPHALVLHILSLLPVDTRHPGQPLPPRSARWWLPTR
jgi:hypothetical protein